jgi:hypothetical protein
MNEDLGLDSDEGMDGGEMVEVEDGREVERRGEVERQSEGRASLVHGEMEQSRPEEHQGYLHRP